MFRKFICPRSLRTKPDLITFLFRRTMNTSVQPKQPNLVKQKFDYFLILDFEATCEANKQICPQEVIEFPCLKMNAKTLEIDSVFHQYVKPETHPILTPFCTELTGIIQSMVENQPNLATVMEQFDQWLVNEKLKRSNEVTSPFTWTFITCGDWDFNILLQKQCQNLGIKLPLYFHYWINVKKPVFQCTKKFPRGMMHMLELLDLKHEGRHHSGIDDVKNISNIVKAICERGTVLDLTSKLS